jgi:predicted Zn-dependent protease with MMP-like domain
MTDSEFDELITRAMNELPQKYINGLQNVAIVMADEPTPEQIKKMHVKQLSDIVRSI